MKGEALAKMVEGGRRYVTHYGRSSDRGCRPLSALWDVVLKSAQ